MSARAINLLPDSKQQRLQAARTRKMIISIATLVIILAVAIPIILTVVRSGQSLYLSRTQDQIQERKQTIQSTENITTILTVKDHLASLPALYQQRLLISKLLDYLPNVTPQNVHLNSLIIESTGGTFSISGSTDSYSNAEKLYRALLQANDSVDPNKVEPDPDKAGYFTNVVLQNVSGPSGKEVSFTIVGNFDLGLVTSGGSNGNQ